MPSFLELLFKWLGHARYNLTPVVVSDGELAEFQADSRGALRTTTKVVTTYTKPTTLAASAIVHTAPCRLVELHAENSSASDRYLQLFDGTTLPVDGTAPHYCVKIPAGGQISLTFEAEFLFESGLVWCTSSTRATKTIAAAEMWLSLWTVL